MQHLLFIIIIIIIIIITIEFNHLFKCDPFENVPMFFIQYTIFWLTFRIMMNVNDIPSFD